MVHFIKSIEEIFKIDNNDYFCLINIEDEIQKELIPIINDILELNNNQYLITTLEYDNTKYKHFNNYSNILLKHYNNLHGIIIKKNQIKTKEDLNKIRLINNSNFSTFKLLNNPQKPILLNNKLEMDIFSIKDLKIAIDLIVYDDVELIINNISNDTHETTLTYVLNNKQKVKEILKSEYFDDVLLYVLYVYAKIDIKNIYDKNIKKILKSKNKFKLLKALNDERG